MMKNKSVKKITFYIFANVIFAICLFFFITSIFIGRETNSLCQNAKKQYKGDCVEALINQLNDKNQSFKIRNERIWALGQFGDIRALPFLQKYYTGNISNKEFLSEVISQYELKKAINLKNGRTNITA